MCGGHELRWISSDYVEKLVARNQILGDVVDQLLTTAVTRREYTRSVAYTVVLMLNNFRKRNCDENLGKPFWRKFCDGVVSQFEDYDWKVCHFSQGITLTLAHPYCRMRLRKMIPNLGFLWSMLWLSVLLLET